MITPKEFIKIRNEKIEEQKEERKRDIEEFINQANLEIDKQLTAGEPHYSILESNVRIFIKNLKKEGKDYPSEGDICKKGCEVIRKEILKPYEEAGWSINVERIRDEENGNRYILIKFLLPHR